MTSKNTVLKSALTAAALLFGLTLAAGSVSAQSAADNIRPAGQVCMQGQACVGQPAGGATAAAAPAAAAATPAATASAEPAAPAAEETVAAAPANDFDVEAAYNMSCMACHASGAAGAPMLGDEAAWNERLEKGMDAVMANVMNGVNAMPARGLCMSCSDEDLHALVEYMVAQ
jgi:cytochrome c5